MFSDQNIDYSLNRPCRTLSAVAPASKSSSKPNPKAANDDDGDDGNADAGWDDDEDYLEASAACNIHKFLVGSSIPSVSKLSEGNDCDDGGDGNGGVIIEEDDEGRTNRLYLLQYHEDNHELAEKSSWAHPTGEVWAMGCHPVRGDWVVTCGGGAAFSANATGSEDEEQMKKIPLTTFRTTLWRLSDPNDDVYDDSSNYSPKLERVVTIPHGVGKSSSPSSGWEQRVGQILWNPLLAPSNSSGDALYDLADTSSNGGGGNLITVGWDAQSPISLWDISSLSDADVKEVWSTQGSEVESSRKQGSNRFGKLAAMSAALPRRVSWDPHDTNHILATSGVDVVAYDMRCSASSSGLGAIRSAHRYGVADVCHNHLQSNVVVTAGMDGVMKFWDLRMHLSSSGNDNDLSFPPPMLKAVRGGHSHWTTRAIYNPFHDQLVLSGGSDGIANLWRISSCSSAPLLELNGDEENDGEISEGSDMEDGKRKDTANEEEDNVPAKDYWKPKSDDGEDESEKENKSMSPRNESNAQDIRVKRFECSDVTADLAWSADDPWVYATLSYDGAIVVHHVPSKEKYKILL
ncbi:hypothetical protein ACHAW5_007565 [Stephanodiscus triporus]|uniref:EIPR1-like beta-propeller domain-containing protein n=1 Tax=Stephanodiscus triporus TaxID=2934178 RepID=A0ABD3Q9L1_9STRA